MPLFALTIFLSAFLLFQIQPVISKAILPWFGGAANVWNTCMLFFQAALLGGYSYAHWLQRQSAAKQKKIHITLLILSALTPIMPPEAWKPDGAEDPTWRILLILAGTIGLPYFVLSTSSPLLQSWYTRASGGAIPWRLFALSNTASLLALLTYPLLVEPRLAVPLQARTWGVFYLGFVALCGVVAWKFAAEKEPVALEEAPEPTWSVRVLWVALSGCASVLLLALTSYLTQDVAAIPFLWVVPLVLYLLTFILCFDTDRIYNRWFFLPALAGLYWYFGRVLDREHDSLTVLQSVGVVSAVLFVSCMVCHGELARLKPHPRHLTGFYVSMSLGGAFGGLFVSLFAPIVFNTFHELPIGLFLCSALAILLLYTSQKEWFSKREGLAALGLLLAAQGAFGWWLVKIKHEEISHAPIAVRNFYGHLHVSVDKDTTEPGAAKALVHGMINHGQQLLNPERRMMPSSYFCKESGAGRAILNRQEGVPQKVGVLGLGCGALLGYGRKGDSFRLYEINPYVFQLARQNFTFLTETPASTTEILGDGRLALERETEPQNFDVLFMDAFSGDSIPVHLVTREAFALYFRHLKPNGVLVMNITNQYLDLKPVMASAAQAAGKLAIEIENSPPDEDAECFYSHYVLILSKEAYASYPHLQKNSQVLSPQPGFREWTDAFSNLFAIVRR
jgi:hypothetical protein